MSDRSCLACGASLEGTRQVKFCANNGRCKMRFHRGARATADGRHDPPEPDGIMSTEAATMLALADLGKLGTPGGQAALVLARRIDRPHLDTGAGLASMVKRLEETLAGLVDGSTAEENPIDELRAARDRKRHAATDGRGQR